MKFSKTLLAFAAAMALAACGKKDNDAAASSPSSAEATKTTAASPLESSFRLKGAQAVDIDELFALMPGEKRPTYESAEFDQQLGATVVSNLRFADANDGEAVLVERAEFYGVDLDAIERIKSAANVDAKSPFETVFQKVRLLNLTAEGVDDEGMTFTIGGVEFDKLAIRHGGTEGNGEGDEAARFFNAVNLSGLYFKDAFMSMEKEGEAAVQFSAPDLRLVGVAGGKLNAFIANDFEYAVDQSDESLAAAMQIMGPQAAMLLNSPLKGFIAPNKQRVVMKSMAWRGIDLSGLLGWGLKGESPPASARNLINLGTMKAVDMETYIDGRKAATVQETTVSAAEFIWLIPSKIRTETKGAIYDFTAYAPKDDEQVQSVLTQYELQNVKGDGYANWTWNPDNGQGDLNYSATMNGLVDFSMDTAIGGLKLNEIAGAEENSGVVARLLTFRNFNMKIADEKALDVIFALSALQMGGTGEDLRQSAPAMIRLSGAGASQMNPRIADYVNAVADFVAQGGTLEIDAAPAKPVGVAELQSGAIAPETLPDVLNLKVTHKK